MSPGFTMLLSLRVPEPHVHCIKELPRHVTESDPSCVIRPASKVPCVGDKASTEDSLLGSPFQEPLHNLLV